jgi:protein SSD1
MTVENAKLAEDQSTHLYLCMLIHELTEKYGPVVREGRVTGVLDAAFDVVIVSFPGIGIFLEGAHSCAA